MRSSLYSPALPTFLPYFEFGIAAIAIAFFQVYKKALE